MLTPRLIARLDIKSPNLIKGIRLEGFRVMGNPSEYAHKYYKHGIDEIIYMDIVASLYERSSIIDLIKDSTKDIFIPITVGGGLRNIRDVESALKSGADKTAINTAAVKNPSIINEVANRFGSQCMVLSVEAKNVGSNKWEVYYDNGREKTGIDVLEWCIDSVKRGAGEILLTSVDAEGVGKGMDIQLINKIATSVNVPVIASGGAGSSQDVIKAFNDGKADAVAIANILHYNKAGVQEIKADLYDAGIKVRI